MEDRDKEGEWEAGSMWEACWKGSLLFSGILETIFQSDKWKSGILKGHYLITTAKLIIITVKRTIQLYSRSV